jgi:hypothetical protein
VLGTEWNRVEPSGTGLHLAFCPEVPHDVIFGVGDDGGRLGKSFVAGEALDFMIENEAFMHANVNALNKDGLSALEYAVQIAARRSEHAGRLVARNSREKEFQYYINKLLASEYIRVHSMFGVAVSSNDAEKYLSPKQLDLSENSTDRFNLSPGMKVLTRLCYKCRYGNDLVKSLLSMLLNEDSGNLKDVIKAQGLVIAVDTVEQCWAFDPSYMSMEVGSVLRMLFVKYSASALYTVERYIRLLHREYYSFNLTEVGDLLDDRYGLIPPLWHKVLAFAGYRNDNEKHINQLRTICTVIDKQIRPFFFGGIQACISRKVEQEIPGPVWELVFEFAGLSASIKSDDVEVSMEPLYIREEKSSSSELDQRYDDSDEDSDHDEEVGLP